MFSIVPTVSILDMILVPTLVNPTVTVHRFASVVLFLSLIYVLQALILCLPNQDHFHFRVYYL